MKKAPLNMYISATRQNDGKTTTSLGLFNAFSDFFDNVGYMKPVGQRVDYLEGIPIDKDVKLMNDVYHISGSLNEMSPVAIPKGYTEDFILRGDRAVPESKILSAHEKASKDKEIMVIEGTGHAGVGSVIGLSNARVAQLLGASVIIVTCGGIGRPIDEVMLNLALFKQSGVNVLGVIVNKVLPDKIEKIRKILRMGFESKGLPVFGFIPYYPMLSSPTILQVCEECRGKLICGEDFTDETVNRVIVGAMPPNTAIDYFEGEVLLITPGNRDDLLLAALACTVQKAPTESCVRGIVLTGGISPHPTILRLLNQARIPTIAVEEDTFSTAKRITNMIVKLNPGARDKIAKVKEIIKEYVDIPTILDRMCSCGKKN